MQIILKQDIPNLGYANDVIDVKPGYARNYLIPQGKAILATPSALKSRDEVIKQKAFKEDKTRKEATALAEALNNITVKIGAKAATTGKIFGSVNAMQLADSIKEQFKYEIDRKKIHVDGDSIKEIGTYTAKIILYKDIQVEVNFEVFAE
ncbi:MAG: 50S ribosomal protein L9 [Bacteroidia bacterium]|jgi:large subunit ribosomal protein L9|nr:50S ribosomal protein L9 [Bacteroidales bacterium]NCD40516.1 50S ribosomal protein L9 [Bacteroidia bacterium]MDD2322017.1 50S ribosomal protein L9 [Bacteroidales bacterium]MDD3009973.1 50S ribosomal protein L9 [Bacteroidales bacterium]MDD3960817.1 50S ribosomal protein L9 [Bacteroidales bacterium]